MKHIHALSNFYVFKIVPGASLLQWSLDQTGIAGMPICKASGLIRGCGYFWLRRRNRGTFFSVILRSHWTNVLFRFEFTISSEILCIHQWQKKTKLRISRLWRTLQIPSEDSLCNPNSQETFVPLRLMAISFLSLSFQFGITYPWRKPLFWFSSEEKTTTGLIYRQKNQTKTPLENS